MVNSFLHSEFNQISPRSRSLQYGIYMATPTIESRQQSEMSDFERRMRKVVTKTSKRKPKGSSPPNFQIIDTLEEYKKVVGGSGRKIVV